MRTRMECEAASKRLDDIARQLEDAIEDWRRFIAANCHGNECNRIFEALEERRFRLEQEIIAVTQTSILESGTSRDESALASPAATA